MSSIVPKDRLQFARIAPGNTIALYVLAWLALVFNTRIAPGNAIARYVLAMVSSSIQHNGPSDLTFMTTDPGWIIAPVPIFTPARMVEPAPM